MNAVVKKWNVRAVKAKAYCKATGARSVDLPTLREWWAKLNAKQRARVLGA